MGDKKTKQKLRAMKAGYAAAYNPIEAQYEYYVDSNETWVWFGIGQILGRTNVELYPYFPASFTGRCKEIHGKEFSKIGRRIGKKILRHQKKYQK